MHFGCIEQSSAADVPITVVNATYGGECGAASGNADYAIATLCDGKDRCELPRLRGALGDAAPSCANELKVKYRCGSAPQLKEANQWNDSADLSVLVCPAN